MFSKDALNLDPEKEAQKITTRMRERYIKGALIMQPISIIIGVIISIIPKRGSKDDYSKSCH